jgi:NhaA family Na+:H+ antiporter
MAAAPKPDAQKTEVIAGMVLAVTAALGLIAANSPVSHHYFAILHHQVSVGTGAWAESHDILDWIKEGLLAVFFFSVGLEIKYEVTRGELSSPRRLALPLFSAAGGMAVPALIYLALNMGAGGRPEGWPIPVATDIVFALAALAAVGTRAPAALRAFLLALAVVDDLGAVLLIAVLFTSGLSLLMIAGCAATLAAMGALRLLKRPPVILYALGAVLVWAFCLKSGVATSVGAVAAALTIPAGERRPGDAGLAHGMVEALRPYVSFLILPIFAFAAAGFPLSGMRPSDVTSPVALGVLLGLVVGKPIGVFGASWLAVKFGFAQRPAGADWGHVLGASVLCGVGFTMSLYLASLAFPTGDPSATAGQLGVVTASLLATAAGVALLMRRPAL